MKELIIERIKAFHQANANRIPPDPTELEIINDIYTLLRKDIEELIDEGRIKVIGRNIRKQRILSV
jgi:hypothetical protein